MLKMKNENEKETITEKEKVKWADQAGPYRAWGCAARDNGRPGRSIGNAKYLTAYFIVHNASAGDFVCGHRVPCHRLTGTFVACNSRHLKSWVGNFSEGPF
jgi:hypothetical protein